MTSQEQRAAKALLETIPGFGPTIAHKVLAYLPGQLLHSGSHRPGSGPPPGLHGEREAKMGSVLESRHSAGVDARTDRIKSGEMRTLTD